MNKRALALVVALLVMSVVAILLVPFFLKTINENNQAKRYLYTTQAFWLAESGVSEAISNMPDPSVSGTITDTRHAYVANVTLLGGAYYTIESTGSVSIPGGGTVSKTVTVTLKTAPVNPNKFKYGIETTTDLVTKGSVDINPNDSSKEFSTLDFADLFGLTKAQMEQEATHTYTDDSFGDPVSGITWVNVDTGDKLTVAGNLYGSGILVINGDAHFSGTVDFDGIIYVIGELTITGTVITHGSVLAESSATVDTELKGNVTINYDLVEIANALDILKFLPSAVSVVSWK